VERLAHQDRPWWRAALLFVHCLGAEWPWGDAAEPLTPGLVSLARFLQRLVSNARTTVSLP